MPLSPAGAAQLAAMIKKLGEYTAGLDIEDDTRRKNSQAALAQLDLGVPIAKTGVNRTLADRGILQSGIGLGAYDTVNKNYLEAYGKEKADNNVALSEIARRRLDATGQFDVDKAELERTDMFGQPIVAPPTPPAAKPPTSTTPAKPKTAPAKPKTTPAKPKVAAPKKPTVRAGVPAPNQQKKNPIPTKSAPKKYPVVVRK